MKRIIIAIIFFTIFIIPSNNVKAKNIEDNTSQVFILDIKTLKYEQKQLVFAIITGDKNSVQTILNSDPAPNTTYAKIPLTMFAIHSNQNEILKILIEDYNFSPNEKIMGVTPIELAISLKKYDAIKYLLSIGVEPSDESIKLVKKSKNKKLKELFN